MALIKTIILISRCLKWIEACDQTELLKQTDISEFYNKYRICSEHFEESMFMNPANKTRLLFSAVPRAYKKRQLCSNSPDLGPNAPKIRILQNLVLSQPTTKEADMSTTQPPTSRETEEFIFIPQPSTSKEETLPRLSSKEIQTPEVLTTNSPRKKAIRSLNVKLKSEIAELQKENEVLRNSLLEKAQPTLDDFVKVCDCFLPKQLAAIVKTQAIQAKRFGKGRRYPADFKQFCMSVYFLGPKCYKYLMNMLCLPSPRTLQRFISRIKLGAGIDDNILAMLELKVSKMEFEDKFCVLCLDELSIKRNLFYNYGRDEIIGIESDGVNKTCIPATTATVFMVRGIKNNWKQPVGYVLCHTTCSADKLKQYLHRFVVRLTDIGLNVLSVVSDMGSNFIELTKLLGLSVMNSEFKLGNKTLLYFFDPPHLIKATRNCMMMNKIHWDNANSPTSWEFVRLFFNDDSKLKNRLAPKLTKSHIDPTNFERMKVKYATQVMSATVAAGLETYISLGRLPIEAMDTVEFISKFDKLFDMFNSSKISTPKKHNKAFTGDSFQINFLHQMKELLEGLKVFKNERDVTKYTKFINGWLISINSLLKLWVLLKTHNFTFLLTRRLNQDCLENFFGCIRQQSGNAINPTPTQFIKAFEKLFYLKLLQSKNTNCQEDLTSMLVCFSDFQENKPLTASLAVAQTTQSFHVEECDYYRSPLPEQNAFKYICGYLIDKCLRKHSCQICEQFATANKKLDESNIFIHFKAYDTDESTFGHLKTPEEVFCRYIYQLEHLFFRNFNESICSNPGNTLYKKLSEIPTFRHPCSNFPIQYLFKLFIRFRIFYVLKYNNRMFKSNCNREKCK